MILADAAPQSGTPFGYPLVLLCSCLGCLLLVSGAVPGAANGYIIVKDASKRARPKDAPYPAGLRKAAGEVAPEAPAADAAPQA